MPNRRPVPRPEPRTVAETILDLEARAPRGDGDFEVPADSWLALLELATFETRRAEANSPEKPDGSSELAELRESLRATKAALEQQRGALAHVLGAGVDTEFSDCLEIARGYVQALDAERQRAQNAEDAAHALAAGPEEDDEEPEHPECPHCGEADGHAPKDCANKGWERPTDAELAADSLRRLNGSAWKRQAKAARESNSLERCHHCGAGDQIAVELEYSKGDDVLPNAMLCAGCRGRLRHTPEEWERRHGPTMVQSLERIDAEAATAKKPKGKRKGQVTLDEAVAAVSPKPRAPGRPTKKFPQGGSDPTERCTQCNAELGEHDGTKCPRAALQHGTVAIHEQQEGSPF